MQPWCIGIALSYPARAKFSSFKAEATLQIENALGFHPMDLGQALSLAPGARGGSLTTGSAMWAGGCDPRLWVLFRLPSRYDVHSFLPSTPHTALDKQLSPPGWCPGD